MSDSVEEVKVSEEATAAEITAVSEQPEVNQDKDLQEKIQKIVKILRELETPVVKSEEVKEEAEAKTETVKEEKEDLVEKIIRDLALAPVVNSEEVKEVPVPEVKVETPERESTELNGEVEEPKENIEAADTPDEEESEEEGEVESEEEGEVESEGEEEESEDNETEDGEQRVRYLPVVIVKERDNGLPFPIVCASSLLVLIYMFKAFLFLCDMTGCNSNRQCIYLA